MSRMHVLTASALGMLCFAASPSTAADITVGLVTSLSGPGASIGIPYAKGAAAGVLYLDTIGNNKIRLIQLDDASDPSAATRDARKLVEEEKVDILMGTSGVPGAVGGCVSGSVWVVALAVPEYGPRLLAASEARTR